MNGILIFGNVAEALRAGFIIESLVPDSEGLLRCRKRTAAGWATAFVQVER